MVRMTMLGAAAMLGVGLASAGTANAAPFGLGSIDDERLVERVADGCGPGFHANPWGRCRPNDRGWGYGGPRGGYGGLYGYGRGRGYGYDRGYDRGYGGYDGPRRFYGGY